MGTGGNFAWSFNIFIVLLNQVLHDPIGSNGISPWTLRKSANYNQRSPERLPDKVNHTWEDILRVKVKNFKYSPFPYWGKRGRKGYVQGGYVQGFLLAVKTPLKSPLSPLRPLGSKKVHLRFVFLSFMTLELHLGLWVYDGIRSETDWENLCTLLLM